MSTLKVNTITNVAGNADITGVGIIKSYAIIADEKSANTDVGSSSGGSWNTRDLNTEIADPDGIVSISSNQFTLQAGTYFLEASAPSYQPTRHRIKLYQTSGTAAEVALGTCELSNNNDAMAVSYTHLRAHET